MVTPRPSNLVLRDKRDTSKSEGIIVSGSDHPQGYRWTSPRVARIWSGCQIVTFVCSVCLALSIHAPREKVNTIIDFMMVPFPLERHKAQFPQVKTCPELSGNTYQPHRGQPNTERVEPPAYVKGTHARLSKHTEGTERTLQTAQRLVRHTLYSRVSKASIAE